MQGIRFEVKSTPLRAAIFAPRVISNAASPYRVVEFGLCVCYVLVGTDGHAEKFVFVNEPCSSPFLRAYSDKPVESEMVVITNPY
jgi:hypothetical protein